MSKQSNQKYRKEKERRLTDSVDKNNQGNENKVSNTSMKRQKDNIQ